MPSPVFAQICKIIEGHWGYAVFPMEPEDTFDEIFDPDSLDSVELAMLLERQFGIQITDKEMAEMPQTVGALAELVERKLTQGPKSPG